MKHGSHHEVAIYLSFLNRTAGLYRQARCQEFAALPRNALVTVPRDWPSNSTRVLAYFCACAALGSNAAWGREL